MKNKIMVSIFCAAYNHEKYITQALDSFVRQKTNFKFEVLVNDDASTDRTAEIIKEYEEKYPEIIKPIYQKENQHSKGIKISQDILMPRAKGKYIAFCEGDDYWCDDTKLQKQFDALEANNDCMICVCGTRIINENGSFTNKTFPKFHIEGGIIKSRDFLGIISTYNFHTSGYMFRADNLSEYYNQHLEFRDVAKVGDEPLLLYFGCKSNVYFVPEILSCYRVNSVSSWSKNYRSKKENAINHCLSMINMIQKFDEFSEYKYHNICVQRIRRQQFNLEYTKENYKEVLKTDYRSLYEKLSFKNRFIVRMNVLFPNFSRMGIQFYRKIVKR